MFGKLKDARVIALLLVYVGAFFNVITMKASDGEGGCTLLSLAGNRFFVSGKVMFAIPVLMVLCILFLNKQVSPKVVYLVGAFGGVLCLLYIFFVTGKKIVATSPSMDPDVKSAPGIGFFIELVVWLFVLIWTLVKDFSISKDSIKEKGIKGTFSDIVNQSAEGANFESAEVDLYNVAAGMTNFVSGLSDVGKIPCPACGKMISGNDLFCTFCGERVDITKQKNENKQDERMTVADYIKGIKDYTCENCGEKVTGNDKFCPNCGKPIVIKIMPSTCSSCGRELSERFTFCPNCGKEVQPMELQAICKKCGADLLFGKDFCPSCGAKVSDAVE